MRGRVLGLVIAAVGLGLVAPPAAGGCAGPQITVLGAPLTPVPPDSTDPTAEPFVTVHPAQVLGVRVTNLGPCQDTSAGTSGCGGPTPVQPLVTAPPVRTAVLTLEQGRRSWRLGSAELGPDATELALEVDLPSELDDGAAVLTVADGLSGNEIRLEVR